VGRALNRSNTARDSGVGLAGAGVYLPLDERERHGLAGRDLPPAPGDPRFGGLMGALADRADGFFAEAAALLPAADRVALRPARIMAEIYQTLLRKMRADGFRVFEKRYRVSHARKLAILSKHLIA